MQKIIDVAENQREVLSAIAGLDAGGQDGVKMDSRWTQDGARCREGDAKVDRENSNVKSFEERLCRDEP